MRSRIATSVRAFGPEVFALVLALALVPMPSRAASEYTIQSFRLPEGVFAHDVMPDRDGTVWFTAQSKGALGRLDPKTGKVDLIPLGAGSAPHGVIVGPEGAAWVTDGGLNAILRVDPATRAIKAYNLPGADPDAALNSLAFDRDGILWFTGQNGIYGVLDPHTGGMRVFPAPRGHGPYGIAVAPEGVPFFASLAGNYLGRIDPNTGTVSVIEPPTRDQGARRVACDGAGGVWISEWNGAAIARYDPKAGTWQTWRIPGAAPRPYALYIDETGAVWTSDWGGNAIWRFEPRAHLFAKFALPRAHAEIREMAGRKGEVWAAESGTGYLTVIRFSGAGP
ncbi:MAG TPA: lyase [Alphaproteobacteria bacterium]|nr:lyase [Alphaproteobacteria bacterium]